MPVVGLAPYGLVPFEVGAVDPVVPVVVVVEVHEVVVVVAEVSAVSVVVVVFVDNSFPYGTNLLSDLVGISVGC